MKGRVRREHAPHPKQDPNCSSKLRVARAGTHDDGLRPGHVTAPKVENVPIPPNVDPFSLSFDDFKKYSSPRNFELLGQSYFKVPERTDWAKGLGRPGGETGSGFNTVRVYDGIAYLAAYNSPPTMFEVLIFFGGGGGSREVEVNGSGVSLEIGVCLRAHSSSPGAPRPATGGARQAGPSARD